MTTDDDYILTIFRVINPYITAQQRKSRPVLIWHGILDSAETFVRSRKGILNRNGIYSEDNGSVINDCNENITSTIAFTLCACSYDVWLANSRGTQYSSHKTLSKSGANKQTIVKQLLNFTQIIVRFKVLGIRFDNSWVEWRSAYSSNSTPTNKSG